MPSVSDGTPICARPAQTDLLGPLAELPESESVTTFFSGSSAPSARGCAAGGAGAPSSRTPALTTEPPSRSRSVCTPAPGIKGAMRRYAMASGHP